MPNVQMSKPTTSDVSVRQMASRLARMKNPSGGPQMKAFKQPISVRNRQSIGRLSRPCDNIPVLYDVVK